MTRAVTDERNGHVTFDIGQLYQQHRARLIGLAAAITLDSEGAEEIVHDAFMGLQRRQHSVTEPVGYLQRSVVNHSISRIRRRRLLKSSPAPIDLVVSAPEIEETWSVVARLSPDQRATIVLRFWADLPINEIAAVLGRPVGSIKSTLHRALHTLREELT